MFPPQHYHGYVLMDGGTVWNINVDSAIEQCLDMGYAESDIIIDTMFCSYSVDDGAETTNNAAHNFLAAQSVKMDYVNINSVMSAKFAYPEVESRLYFQVVNDTCNIHNYLDFNNDTTWCLQEMGRRDAMNMLNIGQDQIGTTLDQWYADMEL